MKVLFGSLVYSNRFYLTTIGNSNCLLRDTYVNGLPSIRLEYSDSAKILCDFLNNMNLSVVTLEKFKNKKFSDNKELFEEYSKRFTENYFSYFNEKDSKGVVVENGEIVEQFNIPEEYEECIQTLVKYLNTQQAIIKGLQYDLNGVKSSFDVYRKQSTQRIKELIELYQKSGELNE